MLSQKLFTDCQVTNSPLNRYGTMITNTCWSRNVRKNEIKSNINLPNFPISCQEISATCIVQIKNNQPSRKYRIRNPEFFTPISQSKCNFNTTILIHVGSLPSSFSKTKHANRMFRIAPQGKRGDMKMPVSSYHGGEQHVQNRIQYEYPAARIQCFGYYRRENAVL